MNLTEHFKINEFEDSDTAKRLKIDNSVPQEFRSNIKKIADLMEEVRSLLGVPITITSGYRSPKLNRAVGGVQSSEHCSGLACDFIAPKFGKPSDICKAIIDSGIRYGQLIEEGTWVHISVEGRHSMQDLTMRNGKYSSGIR